MPQCPNCSYKLVLLQHRRKYKCAKCSRLFLQKEIESEEFQRFNQLQRQLTKEQFVENFGKQWLEYKKQHQKPRKPRTSKKPKLSKEQLLKNRRKYHNKNKNKINSRRRLRYKENNQYNLQRKDRRNKNIELTRLQSRIDYWKNKQKLLADRLLKNRLYTASNTQIVHSVPTFLLCEQLLS